MEIYRGVNLLHPVFQGPLNDLLDRLHRGYETGATQTLFKLYETYRSPERQLDLLTKTKSTKARPWQSAHQFGLAADFACWRLSRDTRLPASYQARAGMWTWDNPAIDWPFLKLKARDCGLDVPIAWDKGHVQHPLFNDIMKSAERY